VPCHTIPSSAASATFAGKGVGWNMGAAGHAAAGLTSASACISCHNGQTFATGVLPAAKPATHITTLAATTDCNICHANFTTFAGQGAGWTMQHSGVSITTCNNCHVGQTFATGVKPVSMATNHIKTTSTAAGGAQCSVCHAGTSTFANGKMGNTGHAATAITPTPCATCHGATAGIAFQGVTPVFKPSNHVLTAADCAICHPLYTTFAGIGTGWKMSTNEHLNVTGTCVSCHTGQTFATGITPKMKTAVKHIPTTVTGLLGDACSNCHSSTLYPNGFATEKMNHNNLQGGGTPSALNGCAACHSTNFASGVAGPNAGKMRTLGNHENSKLTTDCSSSNCHKPLGKRGTPYTSW
jgi:hypothetical protein